VPDDAAAITGRLGLASSLDGLVHGHELLVAAELPDGASGRGIALEDHEVPHEVEQVRGRSSPASVTS
jgi:hypothetical protein